MSRLDLSPMARQMLDEKDRAELEARARAMGVKVQVTRNVRRRYWKVTVLGERITVLGGAGPVAAVMAGALDDAEAVA